VHRSYTIMPPTSRPTRVTSSNSMFVIDEWTDLASCRLHPSVVASINAPTPGRSMAIASRSLAVRQITGFHARDVSGRRAGRAPVGRCGRRARRREPARHRPRQSGHETRQASLSRCAAPVRWPAVHLASSALVRIAALEEFAPVRYDLYSSWRRHQKSVSLRPSGARSSHW
jgi:hypothetical protein